MECKVLRATSTFRIELGGELTFSDTNAFVSILQQVKEAGLALCAVDLVGLRFIDSSGLRMLLLLHDACKECNGRVELNRSAGQVREMLLHSRFDTIVQMND
jgi:anti-anti-sigma factor